MHAIGHTPSGGTQDPGIGTQDPDFTGVNSQSGALYNPGSYGGSGQNPGSDSIYNIVDDLSFIIFMLTFSVLVFSFLIMLNSFSISYYANKIHKPDEGGDAESQVFDGFITILASIFLFGVWIARKYQRYGYVDFEYILLFNISSITFIPLLFSVLFSAVAGAKLMKSVYIVRFANSEIDNKLLRKPSPVMPLIISIITFVGSICSIIGLTVYFVQAN